MEYKYILAIDPGYEDSGFVFLSLDEYNKFDILNRDHINNNDIILLIMQKNILHGNIELVIETIVSYGNNIGQSTIDTAIWAGQFFRQGKCLGLKTSFISRSEVQLNLCNNKRAKPKNMKQALKDRFGDFGTKKNPGRLYKLKGAGNGKVDHIWSALELVITYIDKNYGETL